MKKILISIAAFFMCASSFGQILNSNGLRITNSDSTKFSIPGGIWLSSTGKIRFYDLTGKHTMGSGGGSGTSALSAGHIFVGNGSNIATDVAMSGDGTMSSAGALTVIKINGTSLSGLATGILKNTTTTGVPSIAVAGDFPTLNQNTSGSAATLTTARTIGTITGDGTSAGSSFDGSADNTNALTLSTVNANVGSFGSATQAGTFTVNGKGLITAASNTTITPAVGSITGLGTGVETALGVNTGSAGAPVLFNGAGGTPTSLVGTNITGTAAGLTAGNVTTNANLTGHVTSTGNAAVLGSFTSSNLSTALTDEIGTGNALFSDVASNRQTASYTLVLADKGKNVEMNVASANDLTIPLNATVAFPIGSTVTIIQYGAGLTTVVAAGGVTIRSSSGVLTSSGQYAPMVLQKVGTDEWYLWNGTVLTASNGLLLTGSTLTLGNALTSDTNLSGTKNLGLGIAPLSTLHFRAGSATANTAPLQFTSGTIETTARAGVMEFNTDDLFFTITTAAARKAFIFDNGTRLTSGRVPFATTNGRLTDQSGFSFASSILTVPNLINSGLTTTRVSFATTSGQQTDDADFTFATATNALSVDRVIFDVGSTSANTAPITFASGATETTIRVGTMQYNGSYYLTNSGLNQLGVGGKIAGFSADVNNTSTTETDLFTYTTKASTLGATDEEIEFTGTMTLNDATATSTIKFYFGGTNCGTTSALAVTGSLDWIFTVKRTSSTTVRTTVRCISGTATTFTAETDVTGLTLSNTNIIKVTGTAGGGTGGSSDITAKFGRIMWWPAANN